MRESARKSPPLRDLRSYGRLEALNALLVPGIATYYGWPRDFVGAIALALANLGMVIGLIVGALYWLAVAARIERNPHPLSRALTVAHVAQIPMLSVVVAAMIGVIGLTVVRGVSLSTGVAIIVTLLGALEYVNYYHVQLQHFDNKPDWRRLLAGRGFRAAHLARDLARWRRVQRRH